MKGWGWRRLLLVSAIFLTLLFLAVMMPSRITWVSLLTSFTMTSYFFFSMRSKERPSEYSMRHTPSVFSITLLLLPFVFGVIAFLDGYAVWGSSLIAVVASGLSVTFWLNFFTLPLALHHKMMEERVDHNPYYPSLTVIVPAYNEEKVLARTIESLIKADYPNKEIIVVDDGSTDRTLEVASKYVGRGVKVFHKENGGKCSALNYGLMFAKGDIVVTVDADTIIGRDSLKEVVKRFRDPDVAAVCGNIKVLNRVNWLTKCQALEYVLSINIVRRAFDLFGSVTVVPGALGAFRKSVLKAGGSYDRDTLTEDFDVTVKTLKAGRIVQASSRALAYTEAPETLRDFYRQRMRWYRGNFQTLIKHRDAFMNPRYGFLQKLGFPFIFISMIFLPFAGYAVWASAIYAFIIGEHIPVLYAFVLFTMLQMLLSIIAVDLDGEDIRLTVYAPFFVLGYKHLVDFFIIKSFFDVLLKRKVGWTRARRLQRRVWAPNI